MVVIELGCGNAKTPGAIGVDMNPRSQADVLHNLDSFPYPFENNVADRIICHDVLEHLDNFVQAVEEIWRIGKPGCDVIISGPFMSSVNYHSDPTHRRAFTSRSFDYFIRGTEASKYAYSDAAFDLMSVEYDPDQLEIRQGLHLWLLKWANRNKVKYENRYAFIYPIYQIYFELKVIK
ncbi:MAG: methyltransferase domain-containing protein [Methylomicrobium sp.]|nr:methyltransferase domain-containing protein [Methylomicrobium sp.]